MSSATDLYQQIILEHSRRPLHFGTLPDATHVCSADNPLCGDSFRVVLRVDGSIICEAAFEGAGCAISKASASLMCDAIIGQSTDDFEQRFRHFQATVTSAVDAPPLDHMGPLAAFSGLARFPARIKCAMLCWNAARSALNPYPSATDPVI